MPPRSWAVRTAFDAVSSTPSRKKSSHLPVPFCPHQVKQAIVFGPVSFEVEAQVKQRPGEHTPMVQGKGDQQAADAAVPIEKRVDRFKLNVRQRAFTSVG